MKILQPQKIEQLKKIKVLLFDWDGVFHAGYKNHLGESSFSEADSMGLNLIRLGYYLLNGEIPYTAIITGVENPTAHYLAQRERFNGLFYGVKDKKIIVPYLQKQLDIAPEEILFAFDDVLDLSLAKQVGIRFLVKRKASKIMTEQIISNQWADFRTTVSGDEHAVRSICEFTLEEMNLFEKTMNCRINYETDYQTYWKQRQETTLLKMTIKDNSLVSV